ncbi:Fic family protein [Enterococcus sp. AZ050]|uniref:Fic family protein n=1 Tax=Enterococcus sp. AZ050 TaxID=2774696 RepID=UPI003F68E064
MEKNGKRVHQGIGNSKNAEVYIISELEKLVKFMNKHDVPSLEKCVSHYYLEYIHPFYDGNGRLGRFIACSYLSRKLDFLSAISFSSSIKKQKGVYGTAFSEASNPRNHGELTIFIIEMFGLLVKGQENIIDNLRVGKSSFDAIASYLDTLSLNELQSSILFVLSQDYLFSH